MIPIIVFRSQEEVIETFNHILNAYQVTPEDSVPTLEECMPPQMDRLSPLADLPVSEWAIEEASRCSFRVIVYDDEDTNDIPNDDITALDNLCQLAIRTAEVKRVMVVDKEASPTRSHTYDARLLKSAAELLAYLGVDQSGLAEVTDMDVLTACLQPAPRQPAVRIVRINHPNEIIPSILAHFIGGGGEAFADNHPRTIPAAPRAKRTLPEGYQERLREPEKLLPADDVDTVGCITCYENKRSIKLFPCEHMSLCDTCFETLMVSESCQKTCPECRGDIESFKSCGKTKRLK